MWWRDVLHHREIVRDEQVGQAELVLQVHHEIEDLRLDRHVQRRHRLVADDQARLQRERARDADALALPAGELVRIVVDVLGAQADAAEDVGDARAAFLRVADAVHAQRLADDVAGGHARIERGERVLEDDLHLPPVGAQLRLAEMRDVGAVDRDAAGGRLDQPQDRAADRGLAAAGFADQRERLAGADFQRHAVDRVDVAGRAAQQALLDREMLLEVLDLEHQRSRLRHDPLRTAARNASTRPSAPGASPRRPAPRCGSDRPRTDSAARTRSRAADW